MPWKVHWWILIRFLILLIREYNGRIVYNPYKIRVQSVALVGPSALQVCSLIGFAYSLMAKSKCIYRLKTFFNVIQGTADAKEVTSKRRLNIWKNMAPH